MAIYSCAVSTVGRSTHAPGTAGAHLRYIGREDAASRIEARHMPGDPQEARSWMDGEERAARKNARLCSKVRLALPRELTREQNARLVDDFLADLTGGRVPWFYAIHDKGKDAHNPHAHIVLVDRDLDSGKRVLRLSDSAKDRIKAGLPANGVEWIRERWERQANLALAHEGHDARIDRRSLEAQGIDREPTIHIGPRANLIDMTVRRPDSKIVPDPTPRRPDRVVDYPLIDAGRTRRERNAEIIDLNLEKAARSPDRETRVWAQFEREQRAKDRPLEARRAAAARRRTREERQLRSRFKGMLREARGRRNAESALSRAWTNQRLAPGIAALKDKHAAERAAMQKRQGRLFARFVAAVDLTGSTRRRRAIERSALSERHKEERTKLAQQVRNARSVQAAAVRARHQPAIDDIKHDRRRAVAALKERQRDEARSEDVAMQTREAERERDRGRLRQQIDAWKTLERQEANDGETRGPSSRPQRDWGGQGGGKSDRRREPTPEERREAVRRQLEGLGDAPSPAPDHSRRRRRS